jgi:hypothetical protein
MRQHLRRKQRMANLLADHREQPLLHDPGVGPIEFHAGKPGMEVDPDPFGAVHRGRVTAVEVDEPAAQRSAAVLEHLGLGSVPWLDKDRIEDRFNQVLL